MSSYSSFAITPSNASESANQVFAGPTSGSAAAPNFRSLILADMPGLVFNNCRASLVSGSPYADGSTSGNGTIFFGPINTVGNLLTLDNGSGVLITYTVSQISLSITATSGDAYDLYVYNNAGTLTLTTTVWSNTSTPPTRSTDAAGRLTQSGATNKLLVAVFYAFTTNTVYDCTNVVGSTNPTRRHLSNVYNFIEKTMFCGDTTVSWTYNSTTFRAANTNTTDGVGRVSFMISAPTVGALTAISQQPVASGSGSPALIAIGVDSTTTATGGYGGAPSSGTAYVATCCITGPLAAGLHFLQRIEGIQNGSATGTWFGLNNSINFCQLNASINC